MNENDKAGPLSEEWKSRIRLGGEALVETGFVDRFAALGVGDAGLAQKGAKEAGFGSYDDWMGDFLKRALMARGDAFLGIIQRLFPLKPANESERRIAQREADRLVSELTENQGVAAPLFAIRRGLDLMAVETLLQGRVQALEMFFRRIALMTKNPEVQAALGRLLHEAGVYEDLGEAEGRDLLAPGKPDTDELESMSNLLFLTLQSPPSWNEKLYRAWLLPSLRHALNGGDFTRARALSKITMRYNLSPHREEHEKGVLYDYFPDLEKAASVFGAVSGKIPLADLRSGDERRMALVTTMRLDWGAPMQIALLLVNALNKHRPGKFQFYLYSPYGNPDESLTGFFQEQGVSVRWIDDSVGNALAGVDPLVSKAVQLRAEFAARRIEIAMFFRGDVILESLCSHVRIAPVQIFWSMGYDWPAFHNMDGLLSCIPDASSIKQCDGRPWFWYRLMFSRLSETDAEKVAEMRKNIVGGRFAFGTLCQSFKVDSPEFISSLAEILNRVPNSIYIWTGAYVPLNVVKMMKEHGIHERCVFVGWTDPRICQRVIDVFLDTFIVGNGLSAAEAMSIGTPVVSMDKRLNLKEYVFEPARKGWFGAGDQRKFDEIVKDGGYFSFTNTKDYVEAAVRLATDKGFYRKASDVSSALAKEFLFKTEKPAKFFARAVDDIVKQGLEKNASKERAR